MFRQRTGYLPVVNAVAQPVFMGCILGAYSLYCGTGRQITMSMGQIRLNES
jgi:hypothetical protein